MEGIEVTDLIQEGLEQPGVLPRWQGDGGVEQVDQAVVEVAVVDQEQPLDELGGGGGDGERRCKLTQLLVELHTTTKGQSVQRLKIASRVLTVKPQNFPVLYLL